MKNFCVIDIGTNAVKIKIFANGEYHVLRNKHISQIDNNVSKEDIIKHVEEFIRAAKEEYSVNHENIYILATEGIRSAPNGKEIQKELEQKTHRKVHILDPQREARLSILGGLSSIRLKNNPKQIMFIESGGGSTEISFLDMSKRPFSIVATTSLPIGSRNGKKALHQEQKIKDFCAELKRKGIKIDSSAQIVINAVGASKLMAKQLEMPGYRPDFIAKHQKNISLNDFIQNCKEILAQKNYDSDFRKSYFVKEETVDGFIGHINVLHHIFDTLEEQTDLKISPKTPISTTLGGLKDGAAKEIEQKYKKEALNVKDNTEEEKSGSDKEFAKPIRRYYQEVAQKENSHYVEDENAATYRATLQRQNGEKLQIQASNANNIGITAQDKQGKKKIPNYEDFNKLVKYAKQQKQTISFGNIKSEEFKARLLLACMENGVSLVKMPQIDMEQIDKETSLRLKKAQFHKKEIKINPQETSLEKNKKMDITPYLKEQKFRA